MQLIYEDKDITGRVEIIGAVHRDQAGEGCDAMEIELEHMEQWAAWQPQPGDRIEARQDGYTTGTLYVNTIAPHSGRYRLYATSMPGRVQEKAWRSYRNTTLESVLRVTAAECGLTAALYGLSGGMKLDYLLRRDEGCTAFIRRVLAREGALLKCYNGAFRAIDIAYAQQLTPVRRLQLGENVRSMSVTRRAELKLGSLTVRAGRIKATATDTEGGVLTRTVAGLPATSAAMAGRWARGLLLINNREAEELNVETQFDPALTALARVDVDSRTDAAGQWIADRVIHDFVRGTTALRAKRIITTIGS